MKKPDVKDTGNNKSRRRIWMTMLIALVIIVTLSGLVTGGVIWHQQPGFCAICHTPMNSYVNDYRSDDTTLMITRHASIDTVLRCLDCHESNLNIQLTEGAHWLTGNYTFPLEERKLGTRGFCLTQGCHVEADIIEATKVHNTTFIYSQHDPRHGKQECYSCHSMHGKSVLTCNQCHNFDLPDGWTAPQPNGDITVNNN